MQKTMRCVEKAKYKTVGIWGETVGIWGETVICIK